jgi:hypothetical protein
MNESRVAVAARLSVVFCCLLMQRFKRAALAITMSCR